MLNNLVVPAVRSQEAPIRERGLCCLGLCCILGKNLAQDNLGLFLHCYKKGSPAVKTIALQIITDLIITHPSLLTEGDREETPDGQRVEVNPLLKQILREFGKSLTDADPTVRSIGANAISKAMLSRLIDDPNLLQQLVITFFDPESASNNQLRQSLAYFIPVYCHSRAENASRMSSIVPGIVAKLADMREDFLEEAEAEGEDGNMVTLAVAGQMLLDWTDPRRVIGFAEAAGISSTIQGTKASHFVLAEHILERLTYQQVSKEEKKVLIQMLGKVHLPTGSCGVEQLTAVFEVLREATESGVAGETAGNKAIFEKLRKELLKQLNEVMTAERGGGGAEETVLDITELPVRKAPAKSLDAEAEDTTAIGDVPQTLAEQGTTTLLDSELDDEEEDITQHGRTMGNTTIGAPDAEGTRLNIEETGDTELLDSILSSDEDS
nr:condensin complex subunit 3 [Quercus suber]